MCYIGNAVVRGSRGTTRSSTESSISCSSSPLVVQRGSKHARPQPCLLLAKHGVRPHFFALVPVVVNLLVVMRSPMYFCRNLLLLSSLSCSSLTASMRSKRMSRESCKALACLCRCDVSNTFHQVSPPQKTVPLQFFPRGLAKGLNVFGRSSRTH